MERADTYRVDKFLDFSPAKQILPRTQANLHIFNPELSHLYKLIWIKDAIIFSLPGA